MADHHGSTIVALPDSALADIFLTCGAKDCAAFSAVCRRWRDIVYSEPRLWGTLAAEVDGVWWCRLQEHQRWLHKWRRLLGRVGGVVGELAVTAPDACSGWQAAQELLPLVGPQLDALRLHAVQRDGSAARRRQADEGAAAALLQSLPERFPSLELLDLQTAPRLEGGHGRAQRPPAALLLPSREQMLANSPPLPASWPAALARLPLAALLLDTTHALPDGLVASLPASLTLLRLAVGAAPLPPLEGLTALSQLRGLELVDGRQARGGTMLAVPPLAGFPHLQSFELVGREAGLQVGPFAVASCKLSCYEPNGSRCRELEVCRAQPLARGASLSQLLAALQPPGAPALDALTLKHTNWLTPELVRGCSHLSRLSALHLDGCGGADDWLGLLASQAPGLALLRFDDCRAGTVPPEVAALGSLRQLSCMDNQLRGLPVGPYLSGLERLELSTNQLAELPAAALAAATACRQLGLSGNPLHASVDRLKELLLAGMPALSQVDLRDTRLDGYDLRLLSIAAKHAQRDLIISGTPSDGDEGLYGGWDSSDSDSSDDGCPRYSWAGCAHAAHW